MVEHCHFFHYSNHKPNTRINPQKCGGGGQPNSGYNTDNITDTSTTTTVGEIWTGSTFDKTNFIDLISKITGGSSYNELVTTLNSGNLTATNIRNNNNGKSVVVRLGGLDWIVTYISQDTSGNPIATLWLASNSTTSKWSNGYYEDTGASVEFPSNMYSTSYIRAVSLNNGGTYATSTTASTTADKSPTHTYAKFTMANGTYGSETVTGSVIDYLVTPSAVSWQKTQSAQTQIGLSRNLPNDEWQSSGTGYVSGYDYGATGKACATHYSAWKDDYIWLPSLTETGYNDTYTGLWGTNVNERANTSYSWLRSGRNNNSRISYYLDSSGSRYDNFYVSGSRAVRPALHLNLRTAYESLVKDISSATISPIADQEYTGSAITPSVTITDGSYTLQQGTDYTLSYSNNTNVGTATITITGKDYYIGTKTVVFVITKATLASPSLIQRSFQFTGYEIDITKGTTGVEYGNIKNFDATLMYITEDSVTKRTDVGSFKLKIALKDPNNYQWVNGTSNALSL